VFGSASIEMKVEEDGQTRTAVFSGDIGPRGAPLHRDPVPNAIRLVHKSAPCRVLR
jgi:metallo-beta-lactamase family protein